MQAPVDQYTGQPGTHKEAGKRPPWALLTRLSAICTPGKALPALFVALYAAGLILILLQPTGLALLLPGPALDARGMLIPSVEGTSASGSLLITTVGTAPRATVANLIQAALIPTAGTIPSRVLLPAGMSASDLRASGNRQMEDSKAAAQMAALSYLEVPARLDGAGAQVETEPSADVPGVIKHDVVQQLSVEVHDVIGPSAGLMLALAILERLSRHPLTAGNVVAGTGTIDPAGSVGRIGGVAQKIAGAERAGAEYFLVPIGNYQEALRAARQLRVIPVASLAEAVEFLRSLPAKGMGDRGWGSRTPIPHPLSPSSVRLEDARLRPVLLADLLEEDGGGLGCRLAYPHHDFGQLSG